MKITAVVDKTEALARRNYTPLPEQTVMYLSAEMFEALSDAEKEKFEAIIDKTVKEDKKKSPSKK
jgi:hypothetical protein